MRRTIAVLMPYKSLFIYLSSSGKQEREMTKFCATWRKETTTANFSYIHLELNAAIAYLALGSFWSHWRTGQLQISLIKYKLVSRTPLGAIVKLAAVN